MAPIFSAIEMPLVARRLHTPRIIDNWRCRSATGHCHANDLISTFAGIKDLVPQRKNDGYEGFEDLLSRCNVWMKERNDILVINMRSVIVQKNDGTVNALVVVQRLLFPVPRLGSEVVRIDPLRFHARCRIESNQTRLCLCSPLA